MLISILLASFLTVSSPSDWWDSPEVRRCCSEADAVYADDWTVNQDGSITATITGGGPRNHAWAPIGKTFNIPKDKIINVPGNPTGRPLLFINPHLNNHVFCFALGPLI